MGRDRKPGPRRASTEPLNCFSGEAVAVATEHEPLEASTEPLNCFSGERVELLAREFGDAASTEPLNCFSGEPGIKIASAQQRRRFNGAAELLQRRALMILRSGIGSGSCFNGAAELLQRRDQRPRARRDLRRRFNGAAELLQRRGRSVFSASISPRSLQRSR